MLINCDSSVLVKQLSSLDVKPIARLGNLFDEACRLLESFEPPSLQWISRHRNAQADALARAALGMQSKRAVRASKTSPMH